MTGVSSVTAYADEHVAGVELATVLAGADHSALDDHDLLESVAAWDRVAAWVAARQAEALAELARRPARVARPDDDPAAVQAEYAPVGRWVREFADDEVAARLRISRLAASGRIALACDLHRLPLTRAALSAGRIDVARARVLSDETRSLDAGTAREVEAAVIDRAGRMSASGLRPVTRRAVLAADPVAAQQRAVRARSERRVVVTPTVDGMAELWALLPAVDAVAIDRALTVAARAGRDRTARGAADDRTMDQRRADLLVERVLGAAEGAGRAGGAVGRRAELLVTVAASTLLGLDDRPAELHGYGPITAEAARELAPDARWRRVLTEPRSGAVLDVGTTVHRPPADLQRFVETRSPRCTFPGCRWPATACDLDHTVPFPAGPTSAANLGPRCRRHHRLKHAPGYTATQDADGTTRWSMPTGHRYVVPPPAASEPGPCEPPPTDVFDCHDGPDPPRMDS